MSDDLSLQMLEDSVKPETWYPISGASAVGLSSLHHNTEQNAASLKPFVLHEDSWKSNDPCDIYVQLGSSVYNLFRMTHTVSISDGIQQ